MLTLTLFGQRRGARVTAGYNQNGAYVACTDGDNTAAVHMTEKQARDVVLKLANYAGLKVVDKNADDGIAAAETSAPACPAASM